MPADWEPSSVVGWEANKNGRLAPRQVDLGPSMDPRRLAESAVSLNVSLMRWRAAPSLGIDLLQSKKILLLGAGKCDYSLLLLCSIIKKHISHSPCLRVHSQSLTYARQAGQTTWNHRFVVIQILKPDLFLPDLSRQHKERGIQSQLYVLQTQSMCVVSCENVLSVATDQLHVQLS